MSTYSRDRGYSDKIYRENHHHICAEVGKQIQKSIIDCRRAPVEEDNNHAIDYYLEPRGEKEIPIQFRAQRISNARNGGKNYTPTLRTERPGSLSDTQRLSEFHKIKDSIKSGQPYPKLLVWVLVDRDNKITRLEIINIDVFYGLFDRHKIQFLGSFDEYNGSVIYMITYPNKEPGNPGNSWFVALPNKEKCPKIYY